MGWSVSDVGAYTYRELSNLGYGYIGLVYFDKTKPAERRKRMLGVWT